MLRDDHSTAPEVAIGQISAVGKLAVQAIISEGTGVLFVRGPSQDQLELHPSLVITRAEAAKRDPDAIIDKSDRQAMKKLYTIQARALPEGYEVLAGIAIKNNAVHVAAPGQLSKSSAEVKAMPSEGRAIERAPYESLDK